MMKCEICGELTDMFTDTYDPVTKERMIVYLCRRHESMMFNKISTYRERMKMDYEYWKKYM